ncbi:MAG: hypothetical protein KGI97_00530 [Alphaproteobacteria bacterium]|nr:hypothetical protein [Alphaproteobacteria bacterium]
MSAFSAIRHYTSGLVERHPKTAQKTMSWCYLVADAAVAALPFALHYHDGAHAILEAYVVRPGPVASSLLMMAGDRAAGTKFDVGHGLIAAGAAVLVVDLATHGFGSAAFATMPSVVGGIVGASYKYLERDFGRAKNWLVRNTAGRPKALAGAFLACASVPLAASGWFHGGPDGNTIFAAGLLWIAGNAISFMLPPDDKSPDRPADPAQRPPRASQNKTPAA